MGKDFDGDDISFGVVDPNALPPGLTLIPESGWIVGNVPFGILGSLNYTFEIYVYKTASPEYESNPKTFTISILGQVDDIVEWQTDSDLGTLRIGEISELFVSATTPSNRQLNYRLENSAGTLPYGLILTDDGLISGRVSFETFRLDSGTTTFDENITTLLESTFSIIDGELPLGLSLDGTTGVIKGYLEPFVSEQDQNLQNFDMAPWDVYGFDFTGVSTSKNYQFTIKADNGITIETKVYTIFVFAINSLTADTDLITADNVSLITADTAGPFHTPVILTDEGKIASIRQGTRADIQIVVIS